MHNESLKHHGIKGQRWGVRRFQNYDGTRILKKGTTVKRVSVNKEDRVNDDKKYVSINPKDHKKWEDYMGKGYRYNRMPTFIQTYDVTKDLKVMTAKQQGKKYIDMLKKDEAFKNLSIDEFGKIKNFGPRISRNTLLSKTSNNAEIVSRHIAKQTETGKAFIKEVIKEYDALYDTHGTNLSKNPVIVLNSSKNLKRSGNVELTPETKAMLKSLYGSRWKIVEEDLLKR